MPTVHPPASPESAHVVLIGGVRVAQSKLRLAWESDELQAALQHGRVTYGNAICKCRPNALKLQIRLRSGKLHLAVWPEQGPAHDSECLFFRDELTEAVASVRPSRDGQADAIPSAQESAAPFRTQLTLIRPGQDRAATPGGVSIRSLTQQLWQDASLCRWHPLWSRDYGRVRYEILKAASRFEFAGLGAEELLFVPKVFRPKVQDELNAQWDAFVRTMALARDGAPRMLLGQVREFTPAAAGSPAKVLLRHLRTPIGLHPACYEYLARECRNVLSNSVLGGNDRAGLRRPEVFAMFLVETSSRGGVWARAGWMISVHPGTFIPAANRDTMQLIDQLVGGGYAFDHLPADAPSSQRQACDWLVRHVLDPIGKPVPRAAIEILNPGSTPLFRQARDALAIRMHDRGIPTWTWVPSSRAAGAPLPLPPNDQTAQQAAHEALQQIAHSPHAEYRYGPLRKLFATERTAA